MKIDPSKKLIIAGVLSVAVVYGIHKSESWDDCAEPRFTSSASR
jgi:hypothetical protein